MEEESVPTESEEAEAPETVEAAELAPVEEARGTPAEFGTLRRLVEGVRDNFTVRTVYGDPVEAEGVTVIPVAQTYFGFGAGGGGGKRGGSGGGGGGTVRPMGFIEVTAKGARWVPITRAWQRIALRVLPPIIALLVGRTLRRRRQAERKDEEPPAG
jgi:uncharacterized spore protein YtfJ